LDLISSYTSGVIGLEEKIIVNFTKGFPIRPTAQGVIHFEPSIKGTAKFIDNATLVFEPGEKLERGKGYLAKLNLKKLFPELEEEDEMFEFSFSALRQHFSVDVSGLLWDDTEKNTYKLEGIIRANDFISSNNLKKCFSVSPSSLKLTWSENPNSKSHSFVIHGEPIGVEELTGSKLKVVPAIGDFKVLDLNVMKSSPQQITLIFSEQLEPQQHLKGLIEIEDYKDELEYKIVDNSIRIFPKSNILGQKKFVVHQGVKNKYGIQLKSQSSFTAQFDAEKPQVALLGKGVIVPESEGMMFPFKAVNLRAIDVEIFKIFDDNVLQYFQDGYYDRNVYNKQYVGRIIQQTSIDLKELNQNANQGVWRNYALDLSDVMQLEKGAIYEVRLSFRKEYAITDCEGNQSFEPLDLVQNVMNENKKYTSWHDGYYGRYGYYENYYKDRDNPCKNGFYNNNRFVTR